MRYSDDKVLNLENLPKASNSERRARSPLEDKLDRLQQIAEEHADLLEEIQEFLPVGYEIIPNR